MIRGDEPSTRSKVNVTCFPFESETVNLHNAMITFASAHPCPYPLFHASIARSGHFELYLERITKSGCLDRSSHGGCRTLVNNPFYDFTGSYWPPGLKTC